MLGGTRESFWRRLSGVSGHTGGAPRPQFLNPASTYIFTMMSYIECAIKLIWKIILLLKTVFKTQSKGFGRLGESWQKKKASRPLVPCKVFKYLVTEHWVGYYSLALPCRYYPSVWLWVQRHKSEHIHVLRGSYHND